MNNFIVERKGTWEIEVSITESYKYYYAYRAQLAKFAAEMLDQEIDAEPADKSVIVYCDDAEQVSYVWQQAEKLNAQARVGH